MKPEISVVVSTYNRSKMLSALIESVLKQDGAVQFELIIVDNNSTDDTAAVVERYSKQHRRVRYIFEGKQGVSYGRNAGIHAAQADLIAFTDDDGFVAGDWLRQMMAACEAKRECGFVGGKVVPVWPSTPPSWLSLPANGAPLGLLDYDRAQLLDAQNRRCLITANMAARRKVFEQIGYFTPEFQRTKNAVGTIEDREIQERYWNAGGVAWFDPSILVYADIHPSRMNKEYHRRWHYGHGKMIALLRDPLCEGAGKRLLDIPIYMFRRCATEFAKAAFDSLRGRGNEAFAHEIEARFFAGFMAKRLLKS